MHMPRMRQIIWIFLALALACVLIVADSAVKRAAPGPGFCPKTAVWIVSAEDLPSFWKGVEQSPAYNAVLEEVSNPLQGIELKARIKTGIRPTPLRWRIWLGHPFLAAQAQEGRGICVYPGLLLRAVDGLWRVMARKESAGGVAEYGEFYYAWRDGFLIASPSREYVQASLRDLPPDIEKDAQHPGGLLVQWRGQHEGFLRIWDEEGLPVDGRLKASITRRPMPLTLAEAWPGAAPLSITASKWSDIAALAALPREALSHTECWPAAESAIAEVIAQWGLGALPTGWDQPVDQCSLAFYGFAKAQLPFPEWALALRPARAIAISHPLEPLIAPLPGIPFEWEGQPGRAAPILGEAFTLCIGQYNRDWYAASSQAAMARIVGHMGDSIATVAGAAVRLDWKASGEIAEKLLAQAGEYELIRGMNGDDVQQTILPWARAAARLGRLELNGQPEGEWLLFSGYLARGASAHD